VRELENAIERACALCEDGIIRVADLPPAVRHNAPATARGVGGNAPGDPETAPAHRAAAPSAGFAPAILFASRRHPCGFLREQELTYVNRALAQTGGDKEKAAELLGVSVATIYASGRQGKGRELLGVSVAGRGRKCVDISLQTGRIAST
jgi:transcriptional regulator of acetoin/glycerol metabolism